MNWFTQALTSSIGRKVTVSLTGLFLISFLLVHITGNLLLFYRDNGALFNVYSHFMSTAPAIRILEVLLVLAFVLHIYTVWLLTHRNNSARPQDYAFSRPETNSHWAARNMGITGVFVLIFLIIHLHNFWFRYKFQADLPSVAGENYKDMYHLVKTVFQQEQWFAIFYIVAMIPFGFHLSHAFSSAFQTLGLHHRKYTPLIEGLGVVFAVVIPLGFALMPLYFLLLQVVA